MIINILFYKKEERWYADIPETIAHGGTEENNEMVAGADTWLDINSKGHDKIILQISNDTILDNESGRLLNIDSKGEGWYLDYPSTLELWLCPVVTLLFHKYPQIIYYKILNYL